MAPKDAICSPVIAAADISFSSTYSIFASNLLPGLLKLRLHLLLCLVIALEEQHHLLLREQISSSHVHLGGLHRRLRRTLHAGRK